MTQGSHRQEASGLEVNFVTSLKSGGRMADAETNPMRVDTSLLQGITAANQTTKASSTALKSTGTTTSFSSQLKSATDKETTKAVPGTNYAEILTGPRAGLYVNTGGGARDGEAFVLVKHDNGREDHIYGTGKDRTVVSVGGEKSGSGTTSKTDGEHSTSEKAPTGETTKQVEGRAFHDILTGSRKGLYLNTSGNARDGQAFVLVKRDGREYHIYGTGKDREIFSILDKSSKKTAPEPTETPDTTSTTDTSNTGSTAPTSPLVTDNPS
jgi:hypothetical protein